MRRKIFFAQLLLLAPFIGNAQWFTAGTSWLQENFPCEPNESSSTSSYYLIENPENKDEPILYNSSCPESPIANIKTEGNKVLFKSIGREDSNWYLLYDFGLEPGDWCTVSSIPEGGNSRVERLYYCEEIDDNKLAYGGLPTMKMWDVLPGDEGYPEILNSGIWIKGIGSENGVCDNFTIGYIGGGSKLLEVSHNGEIIYKESPAAISSPKADDFNVRVEGCKIIINSEVSDSTVEVFSTEGMKVFQSLVREKETVVDIPSPGIYVVKVGHTSKKICLN